MTKQNLLKMLVNQRRVKELERLIPIKFNTMKFIKIGDPDYQFNKNRLDELLLEYRERMGKGYTEVY